MRLSRLGVGLLLSLLCVCGALQAQQQPSIEQLKSRSEAGDKNATRALAEAFYLGRSGVEQDYVQAAHWYRKLASQGDPAQVVGAGMLRGLHDTRVPMIFTFIGYWAIGIGVGAWLAFRQDWQGQGIWTGLAIGLAIVAVLMIWRWTRRERLGLTQLSH